jgi:hypothetical protein
MGLNHYKFVNCFLKLVVYVRVMERIELSKDHKISLYAVLIAFFLSFLIGLIAGNPVAVVLIRATVSSLLFGVVLFGGLYVLRRFVPELGAEDEAEAEVVAGGEGEGMVNRPDDLGGSVDYTVSDEGGTVEKAGADIPERMAEASAGVSKSMPGIAAASLEGEVAADTDQSKEVVTPVAEIAGSDETLDSGLEDLTLEPIEGMDGTEGEELPSLDKLFDETEQEEIPDIGPTSGGGGRPSEKAGGFIQVGDARIPNEPEALAKAVKKVMNQDE